MSLAVSIASQRAASKCSDSHTGSTIANSGRSTSFDACTTVWSHNAAHAASSALGSCGSSQTVTRMWLPDAHAGARLEIQPLSGNDVERRIPRVEVTHGIHPIHLRCVVGCQLGTNRGLAQFRGKGLSERDEELPVRSTHIVLVREPSAQGPAIRLERGGEAGEIGDVLRSREAP